MRLEGQKILVTGSSRGIGAGIAQKLASLGASVAVTYSHSKEQAEKIWNDLEGQGHLLVQMDVANEESVTAAFKKIADQWGTLTGLVNNAGITGDQLLMRMKTEDFDKVVATNLKGTFLCTKAATRPLMKAKKGSIVNITSVIGQSGNAGQASYAASKAGIEGFTKSVAKELASRQVRANCVAPGFIVTDMTDVLSDEQKQQILSQIPMANLGQVDDIAHAVAFLLSEESKYITGQTLAVNGGLYM